MKAPNNHMEADGLTFGCATGRAAAHVGRYAFGQSL